MANPHIKQWAHGLHSPESEIGWILEVPDRGNAVNSSPSYQINNSNAREISQDRINTHPHKCYWIQRRHVEGGRSWSTSETRWQRNTIYFQVPNCFNVGLRVWMNMDKNKMIRQVQPRSSLHKSLRDKSKSRLEPCQEARKPYVFWNFSEDPATWDLKAFLMPFPPHFSVA